MHKKERSILMGKKEDNWKTSADYLYDNADGGDKFVMYKMSDEEKISLLVQRIAELQKQEALFTQELYRLEQKKKKREDDEYVL